MNNKVNHQNLLNGLLMLLAILFVMPQGALAQTKYTIQTDGNCEVYYYYEWVTVVVTEAEAGQELSVRVKESANPGNGKYFTGEFTMNGTSLGSNEWGYNEGFTMPAENVTIAAVKADKQTLSFDLKTTTQLEVPSAAALLFNGDDRLNYKDELEGYDVDNSGVADMVYTTSEDGMHMYVQRLAGSDASGTFSLTYSEPTYQYSTISFIFPEKKKIQVQSSWITLSGTEFTYTGQTIEPTVTVMDGTKDITQQFDISYNNNLSAGEATVTVTAKATSTSYTGSVSKTFTITPKKVTISGVKAKDKIYDGTTSAVIDAESAIIDGKVEGDVLTVNAQSVIAVFADAEAGKAKPVTVSGFTLAGDQAGNYTLSAQPTSVTGTIVPKPVTVESGLTVSSTTLNEITGYSVDATNVKIVGAVNNEKLSIMGVIARLQNGSTVFCDLDYTAATIVIGVDKANNYVLAQQGNQATAEITASTETVTNEDGSTIETATTRVKNADGSITETTQETVTGDDGSVVTEKETTIYADGSTAVKQTTTDAEGHQSGIEMSVSADGSDEVTLTSADAGGSETVETVSASRANDDGSTTHTEKVTETTKDADGKVTDTKTTTTESTATSTEHADGSVTDKEMVKITETGADGSELVTGESIRETTTNADGSSEENVSETPDLGDTYGLDDEGDLTPDPEGAEGDNYKEIVNDMSDFIQDNTGVNDDDADEDDQVSVLLGRAADAGNVWLNTNEETDAEGEVIKQDASLTVKQPGSAGGSSETSFDRNPSAQIAIGAGALTSGSNSRKRSDSGKFGSLSWIYSKGALTITGKGTMKQTKQWLKYKTNINKVKINDGVTNIASNAFRSHTKLSIVKIANSVTHIGSNAFQKCKKLTSVNIPPSSKLKKIGQGAFSGLSKLSTINLPSSVTHIGEYAFNKKTRVYVKVPNGKVLNVKITGVSKPKVIKPNYKGKANITSCLFENLSMRNTSRALTLHVVGAVDDDDTGDDPDDSGDDGDDSGDDDDSGSGSDDSGDDDPTQIDLGFDNGGYMLNVDIQGNGNVSVPSSANVGDLVTITVIPDNGYKLAKLYVTDAGDYNNETNGIRPTQSASDPNQYTFQIPSSNGFRTSSSFIIHAIFEAVSGGTGGGGSAIVNGGENKAAMTVTMNYQTKKATDGGVVTGDVYGVNSKVTAANNSVVMIGGTVDKIIGGGTRGATAEQEDDEIEIVSGKEYKILRDGYIVLNFYTPDADITVNSIVFRRPGDANNDGYVNAVDLVEMINAKNGHASERFNLANADIDRDGQITQDDIDAVVKLIMEQTDEK